MKTKTVIFSDIDGTFLDDKYSYDCTKPIVDKLTALNSVIVLCSSKTRKEVEYYRKVAGLDEPFIAENGAAIYIPIDYFPFSYPSRQTAAYNMIELGTPYHTLRRKLEKIKRKTGAEIVGFGDMTLKELSQDTGLPMNLAELAKEREYDEPFRIIEGEKTQVLKAIKDEGMHCTQGGGKYFHLTGDHDKGKATVILKKLYRQAFSRIETFAVGDGPNDLPMLKVVDNPFFIKKGDSDSRFNAWTGILQHVEASL